MHFYWKVILITEIHQRKEAIRLQPQAGAVLSYNRWVDCYDRFYRGFPITLWWCIAFIKICIGNACLDKFLADCFISCILLNFGENPDDANRIIYSYRILITCTCAQKSRKTYKWYLYWKLNLITEIRFKIKAENWVTS